MDDLPPTEQVENIDPGEDYDLSGLDSAITSAENVAPPENPAPAASADSVQPADKPETPIPGKPADTPPAGDSGGLPPPSASGEAGMAKRAESPQTEIRHFHPSSPEGGW